MPLKRRIEEYGTAGISASSPLATRTIVFGSPGWSGDGDDCAAIRAGTASMAAAKIEVVMDILMLSGQRVQRESCVRLQRNGAQGANRWTRSPADRVTEAILISHVCKSA